MMLGNNIRIARKRMGLTQEELAMQIGVTAQAVSRWESEAAGYIAYCAVSTGAADFYGYFIWNGPNEAGRCHVYGD